MPNKIELTGKRFGRLLVVAESERRDSDGNVYWRWRCDCGAEGSSRGRGLRDGTTQSCGCFHRDIAGKAQQQDLAGRVFSELTVIRRDQSAKGRGSYWICQCSCGASKSIRQNSLITGATKSCGHLNLTTPKRRKDQFFTRFGRLLVIKFAGSRKTKQGREALWLCRCDCGTEKVVLGRSLREGNTQSCGCYNREISTTHGLSQTRDYARAEARRRAIEKLRRTPIWADRIAIVKIYQNRPAGMHVDHIIPLQGRHVSGLHVPANLQYLPAVQNLKKNNRFDIS